MQAGQCTAAERLYVPKGRNHIRKDAAHVLDGRDSQLMGHGAVGIPGLGRQAGAHADDIADLGDHITIHHATVDLDQRDGQARPVITVCTRHATDRYDAPDGSNHVVISRAAHLDAGHRELPGRRDIVVLGADGRGAGRAADDAGDCDNRI